MEIKSRVQGTETIWEDDHTDDIVYDDDLGSLSILIPCTTDDDTYNDLLLVEKKIKDLHQRKILTDLDIDILNEFSFNPFINSLEERLSIPRITLSKRFTVICNIISLHMGGLFTNRGYLNYMKDKYNLDEDQLNILRQYIKSNLKHKLLKGKLNDRT